MSTDSSIRVTKDLFLWCMTVVYLVSFTSLYVQLPGLYGDKGILPAKLVLEEDAKSLHDLVIGQPTLLRLLPSIGFDVQSGLDFLCVGGAVLAFVAMISRDQRNCVVFAALWAFYLSVFQVGQSFLLFKWDLLLLEVGFLAVLISPVNFFGLRDAPLHHVFDRIPFWLVRWLLFRLTFSTGVAKMTGEERSSWWSLTAMSQHYETQYLPTWLAWHFYQLPEWLHQLSTAILLTIQLVIPLLYLSPIRHQRLFSFYCQVIVTLLAALTGNYGISTLLTLTLCTSLVDDIWLRNWVPSFISESHQDDSIETCAKLGPQGEQAKKLFIFITYGVLAAGFIRVFNLQVKSRPSRIESSFNFDEEYFEFFVQAVVVLATIVGACSLAWQSVSTAVWEYRNAKYSSTQRAAELLGTVTLTLAAAFIFALSLVPHAALNTTTYLRVPQALRDVHLSMTRQYQLTNSYLFTRRTGDVDFDGRSEVVLEGSDDIESGWKEYNFLFKPGNISDRLPSISAHQPRLDFQMWIAARNNYKQNHWLLHLAYRLLTHQHEVLDLMGDNPFASNPPKYIRASLYIYQFTSNNKDSERYSTDNWWMRERAGDYLPVLSLEEPSFVEYIQHAGINISESDDQSDDADLSLTSSPSSTTMAKKTIVYFRSLVGQRDGSYSCLVVFIAGVLLTLFDPSLQLLTVPVGDLSDGYTRLNNNNFLK